MQWYREKQACLSKNDGNSWKPIIIYLIHSDSYPLDSQKYCEYVAFILKSLKIERETENYLLSADHQVSKWNENRKTTLSAFYLRLTSDTRLKCQLKIIGYNFLEDNTGKISDIINIGYTLIS